MNIKLTTACVALVGLAACDTATPPTAGQSEFNATQVLYESALSNGRSNPSLLSGTTIYNGTMISEAAFDGEGDYRVIGDMQMTVNFSGATDNVTGTVRNINIIDRRNAEGNQLASGGLNIAGSETDGLLSMNATGTIGAVLVGTGIEQRTNVNIDMNGVARNDNTLADTITGTFSGIGSPTDVNGMDAVFRNGRYVVED